MLGSRFNKGKMTTHSKALLDSLAQSVSPKRIPEVLYHYTSAEGLIGILQSKSLWATEIRFLNDSKEYELAVDIATRLFSHYLDKTDNRFDMALLNVLETSLSDASELDVYVISFSEEGDQLSQWRAYCPEAGGFAVGFNANDLLGQSTNRFLFQCLYNPQEHENIIANAIQKVLNYADQIRKDGVEHDRALREAYKAFGHAVHLLAPVLKDPSFSEEQEWRLVSFPNSFESKEIKFRSGRSTLVPYYEHSLSHGNLPIPINELIAGPTPHVELARRAAQDMFFAHGLNSAKERSSKVPYRTW